MLPEDKLPQESYGVNGDGSDPSAEQIAAEARCKGWRGIEVTRPADPEDPDSRAVVAGEATVLPPGESVEDIVTFSFDVRALQYHFCGLEEYTGGDRTHPLTGAHRGNDFREFPTPSQAVAAIFEDSAGGLHAEAEELECEVEDLREQAEELTRLATTFQRHHRRLCPHL